MFRGNHKVNFTTDKPQETVLKIIKNHFSTLGAVENFDSKIIKINAAKFNGFTHNAEITGTITQSQNNYSVGLTWEPVFKPIFFACCILVVPLFGLVYMGSQEMQKSCTSVLENLRNDLKS